MGLDYRIMEEIRIQKYISDCGVMSRRAAEVEIKHGQIYVNGQKAVIGQKIDPEKDIVKYKDTIIGNSDKRYQYIILYKPSGYVTTLSDEKGRKCITELVSDVGTRVYPVGRLDMDSEGLLLLTNDGELTNKLTHPKHKIPKIYHVKIVNKITPDELKILRKPMLIDDYMIQPVQVEIVSQNDYNTVLRMTLFEGRNRQIRKMCENMGLSIINLKRIAIGNITLGDLHPGKWRRLTQSQVKYLKEGI